MSYVILGRAIKNEHLALGVLTTAFGGAWLATRGNSSASARPTPGQSVQEVKASVPLNASSNEEEEFIRKFVAEAEKEDSKGKH
ncbi:hypothetical protein AMATHDRAFT_184617 [Amanita thiersii Skay4041]|uniref:Uncharacterized protein n=1 Tax=Amanita thiersii Skay4041 TaxID=703135 RepID=A0A2A9NC99_9AGAR|nr:hypothetical protein AMATHDRAFT_184617 [Amanita thiersii Skay4041]